MLKVGQFQPRCGTGGRASFREVQLKGGGFLQFDHGCQFIMASNPLVAVQVREWELQRKLSLNQVKADHVALH